MNFNTLFENAIIDRGYMVSLSMLMEIFKDLCGNGVRYQVADINEKTIIVLYQDADITLRYAFPVIATVPLSDPNEGIILCMYPLAAKPLETGQYLEDKQLKQDCLGDWERFWCPLEALLLTRYKNKEKMCA